ncbi:transporter [Vibrio sp. SG41-7]|uniref:transporter n=1 Tax=Vibrio sp. SG41-7 TaxID=2760973 RepID=UPI0016013123|nr:transporter [Vibrio sp. SG41-7]MBB1464592.1 transporter [Vibrio sp. SG41-7]
MKTPPLKSMTKYLIGTGLIVSTSASAITLPPRFYERTLLGVEAIPILGFSFDGNINPLDPTLGDGTPQDDGTTHLSGNMALAGYSISFPIQDRSARIAYLQPIGGMDATVTQPVGNNPSYPAFYDSTNGVGDPFFEFTIGLIGTPALDELPKAIRYQPGFQMDLLLDLSVPLGEYDEDNTLNMGTNRFWGRVGFPMMYQLGDVWAPSKRASFELLPAITWYGDNDDFHGGSQSTDLGYSLGAHLTYDVSQHVWVSLNYSYVKSGDYTNTGADGSTTKGDGQEMSSVGVTVATDLTRNLNASIGYSTTINDDGPGDAQMSTFSLNLTYYWADILDGLSRTGFKF